MFQKALDWILARAQEPSTWRGLIAIVTSAGVAVSPDMAAGIIAVGLALGGLVNVFRKEMK